MNKKKIIFFFIGKLYNLNTMENGQSIYLNLEEKI